MSQKEDRPWGRGAHMIGASLLALWVTGCIEPAASPAGTPASLSLDDAERFATLFTETDGTPTAAELQERYLAPGTEGIAIFTPYRIKDADNLATKIAANPGAYRKGIDVCLPSARAFAKDSASVMEKVSTLLGEASAAPAFALFGADNSGGTADKNGLVLGLEVLCRFASEETEAREVLEDYVVHEITHVYQQRAREWPQDPPLIQAVIVEGFADFVMESVLGRASKSGVDRAGYGEAHEAALWREFQEAAGAADYGEWLYKEPAGARPPDLGYWIGKRICEAYYGRAANKSQALRELLLAEDPQRIVEESHYGEEFAQ